MTNTTYRSQLEILSICKYTINNISNSITSIRTCLVNTDIADHITSILHSNGMNTTKVMMKTVTMITPIPMTVPKRKNEEKILKYLWLHLSEKEDVSFPTFPLL